MSDTERILVRCTDFDLIIEDHGIPLLYGRFEADGGLSIPFPDYMADISLSFRFLCAIGKDRLSKVRGTPCWLIKESGWGGKVLAIEPLFPNDGTALVFADWVEWVKRRCTPLSASEMRTGIDPNAGRNV